MAKTSPIHHLHFAPGSVIFDQGEPSTSVYRIQSGTVRLSLMDGEESRSTIATLGAGDIFGEAGIFGGEPRSCRAEAADEVSVDALTCDQLAEGLEQNPHIARALIRRLFDVARRLRAEPAQAPPAGELRLTLLPADDETAAQIGREGVAIDRLPFVVGRILLEGEKKPGRRVDLPLIDYRPYNLSRRHFAIDKARGALVVRDDTSHHGTMVNGQLIGKALETRVARLVDGENEIIAGRESSPFRFKLVVRAA